MLANKNKSIQRPKKLFWLLNSSGWFLLFLINVLFQTKYLTENFDAFFYSIIVVLIGMLSTLVMRYLILRINTKVLPFKKLIPYYILIAFGATLFSVLLFSPLAQLFFPSNQFSLGNFIGNLFNFGLVIAIWLLIYVSFLFFKQQQLLLKKQLNLSLQLKDAELNNLRKQLSPHFLFNTINNIRSLILLDPEKARDALLDVSSLLRYALNYQKKNSVTIVEEMEIVNGYINLNKIHLGKNISFTTTIALEVENLLIPPMSIQLLVENAIKHGSLVKGGTISVTASPHERGCAISVINPGKIDTSKTDGIGLSNLKQRLNSMYTNNSSFELFEKENHVHAKIVIK